jgi:hypothetical protein
LSSSWDKSLATLGFRRSSETGEYRAEGERDGWRVVVRLQDREGEAYTWIGVPLKRSLRCGLWASTMPPDDGDDRADIAIRELPDYWRVKALDEQWAQRLLAPLATMLTRRSGRGRDVVLRDHQVELWCGELDPRDFGSAVDLATDLAIQVTRRADRIGSPAWERCAREHWQCYADSRGFELASDALTMSGRHRAPTAYRTTREVDVRFMAELNRHALETRVTVSLANGQRIERCYAGIAHDEHALDEQVESLLASGEESPVESDATAAPTANASLREPGGRYRPRRERSWIVWAMLAAVVCVVGARRNSPWIASAQAEADVAGEPPPGPARFDYWDCAVFCQKAVECGGDGTACIKQCPDMDITCRECLANAPCYDLGSCKKYCEKESDLESDLVE